MTLGARLGDNVRVLRAERRWTQEHLSEVVAELGGKLSRSRIAELERGEVTDLGFAQVIHLATAFNVPFVRLFAGTGVIEVTGAARQTEWLLRLLQGGWPLGKNLAGPGAYGRGRMRWAVNRGRGPSTPISLDQINAYLRDGVPFPSAGDEAESVVSLSRAARGEPRRR